MADTPVPDKGRAREIAGTVVQGAIKYLIYVALVVGSIAAVFYTSQSTQDNRLSSVTERVSVTEHHITKLEKCDDQTARAIEDTKKELADTRLEMVKIATHQHDMAREQTTLSTEQKEINTKIDELKVILIRMENGSKRTNPQ